MLKTLALTLTLLLSFTVAACSSTSGTSAKIDQTTANAVQTAPTDAVQRVRLTLANQDELIVKLNGTRAATDFLSLLPLELTCKDFNNTEKVAYLPRRLDTQGAPAGFDPQTGSFAYYAPWGNLAFFYRDYGYANSLIELGTVESGIENWPPSIMISLLNWNACPKKTELAQCKLCFFRLSAFPSISQRSLLYSELYNRPQE